MVRAKYLDGQEINEAVIDESGDELITKKRMSDIQLRRRAHSTKYPKFGGENDAKGLMIGIRFPTN